MRKSSGHAVLPRSTPGESFDDYCKRIHRLGLDGRPYIDLIRAWDRVHGTPRLRLVVDNTA